MRTCVRATESPPTVRLAGDRDVLRRGPHGEGTPAAIRVHEPCLERGGGARRRAAPARPQRALARRNARGGSAPARGRVIADRGSESPRRLKADGDLPRSGAWIAVGLALYVPLRLGRDPALLRRGALDHGLPAALRLRAQDLRRRG